MYVHTHLQSSLDEPFVRIPLETRHTILLDCVVNNLFILD